MLSKVLEWACVSIGTLLLKNMEGRSFLTTFEIKRFIKRCVKTPCKQVSLSIYLSLSLFIGAPLRNLEGFACRNFLKENDSIFGLISWT
jgi:hypothetical protein